MKTNAAAPVRRGLDPAPQVSSQIGEPTWELAERLYPKQGEWTEEEYLRLSEQIDGRVEFVRGFLDFHSMADWAHSLLCRWIYDWLRASSDRCAGGEPMFASTTLRVIPGEIDREPDVFLLRGGVRRGGRRYPEANDVHIAFEVVCPDAKSIRRDHRTKRTEYAAAGIPEYWIVDATDSDAPFVLVLALPDGASEYVEHGRFRPGETATSAALPGLTCEVAALFAAAEE